MGLAAVLTAVTAVQFVALALTLLRLEVRPGGAGMVAGFVITVVWLLTISRLVLGAWRRTVWGCPFDHTTTASGPRRCARHRILDS